MADSAKISRADRKSFLEVCLARFSAESEGLVQEISTLGERIAEQQKQLGDTIRRRDSMQADLRARMAGSSDQTDRFATELETLLAQESVTKVVVDRDGRVTISSCFLYLTEPNSDEVRELGEFDTRLTGGRGRKVEFFNKTIGERTGYHHPHVGAGHGFQEACLGNVYDELHNYLARYQFVPAYFRCLDFLQTYNYRDMLRSESLKYMGVVSPEVVRALSLRDAV